MDKGKLELTFRHPLLNTKIKGLSFSAQFKKSELNDIHSLIHTDADYHEGDQMISFPEIYCILSIRLTRKHTSRSFTSLVWLIEQRARGKKVYFCSVKLDLHTKDNLIFLPEESNKLDKHKAAGADINLIPSKPEVTIGSATTHRGRHEKYEFYSSIKKSKLNDSEDNYRFNGGNAPTQPDEQIAHRPANVVDRAHPMQTTMDFLMLARIQPSSGVPSNNHENSQRAI